MDVFLFLIKHDIDLNETHLNEGKERKGVLTDDYDALSEIETLDSVILSSFSDLTCLI